MSDQLEMASSGLLHELRGISDRQSALSSDGLNLLSFIRDYVEAVTADIQRLETRLPQPPQPKSAT